MKKTCLFINIIFLTSLYFNQAFSQTFSLASIPQHSTAFTVAANCNVAITSSGGGTQQWQGTSIGTNGLGGGGGSVAQNCSNQTGLRLEMSGAGNSTGTGVWNNSITVTFTFPQGVKGPATFNIFDFTEPFYNDGSYNYAYYQDKATITSTKCDGTAVTPILTSNNGPVTTSTSASSLIIMANKLQGQCLNQPVSVGTATDLIKTITVVYSNQDLPTNVPTPVGNPPRYGISQYQYIFIGNITANPPDPIVATATPSSICLGQSTTLTATSASPYVYSWSPTTVPSTGSPVTATPTATTTYTVTGTIGSCIQTSTVLVTLTSGNIPTFTALGPYCVGATPVVLPTSSSNGITGVWSPTTVSTATAGTTVYTFTPNPGQCAGTFTMSVLVTSGINPIFTPLGPYCVGTTPGTLPIASTNAINGSWSPSTITTATLGITVYTFTPTVGQCALPVTMSIDITSNIIPIFTPLGPYCVGTTPAVLPSSSNNGISGSWIPSIISTTAIGTTSYTFTPNAGQCASTTTMDISVASGITPTFNSLGPYCVGDIPPPLSDTSFNNIVGTWSPAVISTTTSGTTVYTFTPNAGQCGLTNTVNVIVDAIPTIIATASPLSICLGQSSSLTATGASIYSWAPVGLLGSTVNVSPSATTVYTVTGITSGGCSSTATVTVSLLNISIINLTSTPDVGCVPLAVQFNFVNDGTIDPNTLHWDFGDPSSTSDVSSLASTNYTYYNSGSFIVTLSATALSGCVAIGFDTINVLPNPLADFTANPWVTDIYSPEIHFYDASINANEWLWFFGDAGNSSSTQESPIHTYSVSGDYPVMLIVHNGQCADTVIKHVIIGDGFTYFIPNTFSPNEDNKNEIFNGKGYGFKTDNFELLIFDRWGELIFQTKDPEKGWDGTYQEKICMQGAYVYRFKVVEMNNIEHIYAGAVMLIK